MTLRPYAFLVCLIALLAATPVYAQRLEQPKPTQAGAVSEEKIAAVVNDGIITTSDVLARLRLAFMSSNFPDTPEVRKELVSQVLRSLIDEEIKIQEARQNGISISDDDVRKAIDDLAKKNNVPGGDMAAFLRSQGVPLSTLQRQARAFLSWMRVVQQQLRPRISVADDEVQAVVDRMRANAGKKEYLVYEIYLSVDQPSDEQHVAEFAKQLMQRLKTDGNFEAIARQFSQGTEAANGGAIGWVQDGQLSSEVSKAIQSAHKGDLVGPIRSASGFHLLVVRDDRIIAKNAIKEASMNVQQLFKAFNPSQSKEALVTEVKTLRANVTSCDGLASLVAQKFQAWRWLDLGTLKPNDTPDWLADKVRNLAIGEPSEAMATPDGALILIVCDKQFDETIDRTQIINTIGTDKLELVARRRLQDLKASAYIDIRTVPAP